MRIDRTSFKRKNASNKRPQLPTILLSNRSVLLLSETAPSTSLQRLSPCPCFHCRCPSGALAPSWASVRKSAQVRRGLRTLRAREYARTARGQRRASRASWPWRQSRSGRARRDRCGRGRRSSSRVRKSDGRYPTNRVSCPSGVARRQLRCSEEATCKFARLTAGATRCRGRPRKARVPPHSQRATSACGG